jgi:integrase
LTTSRVSSGPSTRPRSSPRRRPSTQTSGIGTCCRASAACSCGGSRLRSSSDSRPTCATVVPASRRSEDARPATTILQRAVVRRRIASNPVAAVKKPSQRRTRAVVVRTPAQVEKRRSALMTTNRRRDAALISVLAYAGLRPGEALALRWGDIRRRTIVVERAISLGEEKDTKSRSVRTVNLLGGLPRISPRGA